MMHYILKTTLIIIITSTRNSTGITIAITRTEDASH